MIRCYDCGADVRPSEAVRQEVEVGRSKGRSVFSALPGVIFQAGSTTHYADVFLCAACAAKRTKKDDEDESVRRIWVPVLVVLFMLPVAALLAYAVWFLCR